MITMYLLIVTLIALGSLFAFYHQKSVLPYIITGCMATTFVSGLWWYIVMKSPIDMTMETAWYHKVIWYPEKKSESNPLVKTSDSKYTWVDNYGGEKPMSPDMFAMISNRFKPPYQVFTIHGEGLLFESKISAPRLFRIVEVPRVNYRRNPLYLLGIKKLRNVNGLFGYPTHDTRLSKRSMGEAANFIRNGDMDYLNSMLCEKYSVNVMLIGFTNATDEIARRQEQYWNGGKPGDIAICFGTSIETNGVSWVYTFGDVNDETKQAIARAIVASATTNKITNLHRDRLVPMLATSIIENYKRKYASIFDLEVPKLFGIIAPITTIAFFLIMYLQVKKQDNDNIPSLPDDRQQQVLLH